MSRSPIVLDTNLLLLFVVGTASRYYIVRHKRLSQFVVEDFDMLRQILSAASDVLVTPNILTETSNLAVHIADPARTSILRTLREIIMNVLEKHIPSEEASSRPEYLRLGLTDAGILQCVSTDAHLLTTDLGLYVATLATGAEATNFNHIRDSYL